MLLTDSIIIESIILAYLFVCSYCLQLLELLMNNIGERIQKQVIESGVLPVLVRIVTSKVSKWTTHQNPIQFPKNCRQNNHNFITMFLSERVPCSREDFSSSRRHTVITWWSKWKVSWVLFGILWFGRKWMILFLYYLSCYASKYLVIIAPFAIGNTEECRSEVSSKGSAHTLRASCCTSNDQEIFEF